MRAVLQRVSRASVEVEGRVVGSIEGGLLVYLGVGREDGPEDLAWMAAKIPGLRIFADGEGAMNRSLLETGGSLLLVSQFTLLADARKGRRPSFSEAAPNESAIPLYEGLAEAWVAQGLRVEKGIFGADMKVASVNDGPVTILLDSKRVF